MARWNELNVTIREVPSLAIFKRKLKDTLLCTTNKLYSLFDGRSAINHTRLRLGLSGLNGHRSLFNFITFSSCSKCGYELEDVEHFFLFCPVYTAQRETLLHAFDTFYDNNFHRNLTTRDRLKLIAIMLTGDKTKSIPANMPVFTAVQLFIQDSKRLI